MLFHGIPSILLLCAAKLAVAAPPSPAYDLDINFEDLDHGAKNWSALSLDSWDPVHDAESQAFMAKVLAESGVEVNVTETENNEKSDQLDKRAMCSWWWYQDNNHNYNGWTVQIRGYFNMYFRCSSARFPNDRASLVPLLREIVTRIKANNNAHDIHISIFDRWTLTMTANAGWWYSDIPARLLSDMFGMTLQNMHRVWPNENGARFSVYSSNVNNQRQLYSFFLRPSDCGANVNEYYNQQGSWPC